MATNTPSCQYGGSTTGREKHYSIYSSDNEPRNLSSGAVGILSRTLMPSTTIQWILPARIRHRDHNDVVFVSETFVQLREFLPTCILADTPTRLNLGCRILAAKVLSHHDWDPFVDLVVKQERQEMEDMKSVFPPEILVLALDRCEIAFIYAEGVASTSINFRVAKTKLPSDVSSMGQYGRHVALDSKSFIMAISPAYGQFGLLQIKSFPELCEEIAAFDTGKRQSFQPLKELRFIPVIGLILKMEFLLSPSNDQARTVLALLISHYDATHLFLYSSEENAPLRLIKLEDCGPHTLPEIDRLPLMMIPSSHNTSFTLVTESGLTVYDDVLSSSIRRSHIAIPQSFPENFVRSRRSPLWVQWAKPHRNPGYRTTNDDFVLVREDGILEYFEIKHNTPSKLDIQYVVGSFNINVDSAFAILNPPPNYDGDIYVVGGDMNDGAVYRIRARGSAESFQTITNLAPILDMLIVDSDSHHQQGKRMFLCSGKGEDHAAVAEIRHGLEAKIGFEADYQDAVAATRVWILPQTDEDALAFVVSLPSQTTALRVDPDNLAFEVMDDELESQGLHIDKETLALGVTTEGALVQITPSAITILSSQIEGSPITQYYTQTCISLASIHPNGLLFAIVAVGKQGYDVIVSRVLQFDKSLRILDSPRCYSTDMEPNSVMLFNYGSRFFLIIGTISGTIDLLEFQEDQGPSLISRYSITTLFPELTSSAICSLVFLNDLTQDLPTIACGTRNGWLLVLTMTPVTSEECFGGDATNLSPKIGCSKQKTFQLRPEHCRHIGRTAVKLSPSSANKSSTLILCNSEVYRLSFSHSELAVDFQVSRIWWTKAAKPDFNDPKVSAVADLATYMPYGMEGLETRLVCLTASDILVASLPLEPSIVPRRIAVGGDPSKILFCKAMNKLVVAINQNELVADRVPRRPARRLIFAGIQFLDTDTVTSNPEERIYISGQAGSRAGSRITCMLTWTANDDAKVVDVIIIGVYVEGPNAAQCDGRLMCIKASEGQSISDMMRRTHRFTGSSVYSLARYGESSVVVGAGKELLLPTLDVSEMRWTWGSAYMLPSPATHIHVSGRFIYTTTARHSLIVFEVDNGRLSLRADANKISDVIRDTSEFVGADEGGLLVTLTNKGSLLLGLSREPQGEMTCVFHAVLPLTITCIKEARESDPFTMAGKQYYGSTLDGSLYGFTILSRCEWICLDFIARLSWKLPVARSIARRKGSSKVSPYDMHISGDKIVELLRRGPTEFRRLLEEPSRSDLPSHGSLATDQRLQQLAKLGESIFGVSHDPVLSAFQWMRKLLRVDK